MTDLLRERNAIVRHSGGALDANDCVVNSRSLFRLPDYSDLEHWPARKARQANVCRISTGGIILVLPVRFAVNPDGCDFLGRPPGMLRR